MSTTIRLTEEERRERKRARDRERYNKLKNESVNQRQPRVSFIEKEVNESYEYDVIPEENDEKDLEGNELEEYLSELIDRKLKSNLTDSSSSGIPLSSSLMLTPFIPIAIPLLKSVLELTVKYARLLWDEEKKAENQFDNFCRRTKLSFYFSIISIVCQIVMMVVIINGNHYRR